MHLQQQHSKGWMDDQGYECVKTVGVMADAEVAPSVIAQCRYCHEEVDVQYLENPCACNGTLKFAHRKCVQQWCDWRGHTTCEICHQHFKPAYTALPPHPLSHSSDSWEGFLAELNADIDRFNAALDRSNADLHRINDKQSFWAKISFMIMLLVSLYVGIVASPVGGLIFFFFGLIQSEHLHFTLGALHSGLCIILHGIRQLFSQPYQPEYSARSLPSHSSGRWRISHDLFNLSERLPDFSALHLRLREDGRLIEARVDAYLGNYDGYSYWRSCYAAITFTTVLLMSLTWGITEGLHAGLTHFSISFVPLVVYYMLVSGVNWALGIPSPRRRESRRQERAAFLAASLARQDERNRGLQNTIPAAPAVTPN